MPLHMFHFMTPLIVNFNDGANAVEFIINHAEVPIAFVQENKIPDIIPCLPNCSTPLKSSNCQLHKCSQMFLALKEGSRRTGGILLFVGGILSGNSDYELPLKQRTAVCTIMCRSGTTREPKGLIVTNAALMSEVLSTDHILFLKDRMINKFTQLTSSIF
ncbi:putative long-chain-fatty-acid--CoA ligase [Rosa chinensis]|uniref:Putative long-chain-fatty-acid--CoA ligase n=1 Tax=Rosa chinensis TaxID=74649 RepID=A0A2P6SQ47_ROSCH|nr:putative long-chain-fatty-acid--CoA ligase [Rosa chinensis]